jgi:pyruvate dehydrogenase (quinone)
MDGRHRHDRHQGRVQCNHGLRSVADGGTDYPYSNFLPSKGTVVQVDERPQVLGRRAPTVHGVAGSARPTLKLLLDQVAPKTNTQFWDKVTQERQKWG